VTARDDADTWREQARAYVEEHGYVAAERLRGHIERELALLRKSMHDLNALHEQERALRAEERRFSAPALRFSAWLAREAPPRECFEAAPLDRATFRRLKRRFPQTPDNLWARWLDGDDCIGCPSGARDAAEYWEAVARQSDRLTLDYDAAIAAFVLTYGSAQ
jgi:hypothetical protein